MSHTQITLCLPKQAQSWKSPALERGKGFVGKKDNVQPKDGQAALTLKDHGSYYTYEKEKEKERTQTRTRAIPKSCCEFAVMLFLLWPVFLGAGDVPILLGRGSQPSLSCDPGVGLCQARTSGCSSHLKSCGFLCDVAKHMAPSTSV